MINCKVTKNKSATVMPGDFGRPWRITAQVFYVNTTLQDSTTISEIRDINGWCPAR